MSPVFWTLPAVLTALICARIVGLLRTPYGDSARSGLEADLKILEILLEILLEVSIWVITLAAGWAITFLALWLRS